MSQNPDPKDLVHLADQWTVLREQYAFLGEALLRLIADHPDLPSDVIQGAMQNVEETRRNAFAFNQALSMLRE
jgi:hypothetical protein